MIGTYAFKYHGILKNFNFENFGRSTFHLLIDADIFNIKDLSPRYQNPEEYLDMHIGDSNVYLNDYYIYNYKEYHLKLNVLEDMFDYCEFKCEPNDELERKTRNLEFNLETYVSNYSKIKYLKEVIFAVKNQILNKDYYPLYTRNLEIDCYKSWFQFFRLEQIEGEDLTYIYKYLKGDEDFVPPFIKNLWENYFYAKGLIDFCTKRILHLERLSGINESDVSIDKYSKSKINYLLPEDAGEEKEYHDIRLDIFKDIDSRKAFDFILNEWKGAKNTAFYSKVFKYLQSKNYIIIEGDDSDLYRDFIMSNFLLDSFTRIQKRTSNKKDDVWTKAYIFFEGSLEKLYSKL
jgi:hypothetical protein